jgi:hypothetical protein
MSAHNLPRTVEASLDARLAPFHRSEARPARELENDASRNLAAARHAPLSLVNDLKLLFAALGAGGSVVPLGDNRRAARLLARYAESLRDH